MLPSASQMTQSPEASAGDEHRITFPIYDKEGRPTEYEFTSGLGITSSGNQEDLPPTTLLIVPTDDLKKTVEADLHSETTVLVEPKTVAKTVSKALALASATVSSGPPALNSTGAEETAQDHKARDACIAGATMVGGSIVLGYMFSKFKKKNT
ncbi:hypothetical protein QFC19_001477 [Naganishia cerealis]|uniref:Uncharacterized protein n=1 Tax=Naganishia cerealis TaxID=610337 RepID=A0ACC2WFX5_9TREE|nr:hypothetical protein QFC19_001477 [Naganishia cerealis]